MESFSCWIILRESFCYMLALRIVLKKWTGVFKKGRYFGQLGLKLPCSRRTESITVCTERRIRCHLWRSLNGFFLSRWVILRESFCDILDLRIVLKKWAGSFEKWPILWPARAKSTMFTAHGKHRCLYWKTDPVSLMALSKWALFKPLFCTTYGGDLLLFRWPPWSAKRMKAFFQKGECLAHSGLECHVYGARRYGCLYWKDDPVSIPMLSKYFLWSFEFYYGKGFATQSTSLLCWKMSGFFQENVNTESNHSLKVLSHRAKIP